MKKILGINNGNYMDMLLSKKMFSFKINKLSTTDNLFNGKPCDVLYTGYLNKDISFGDIVYFEPKNIQYKKLVNGVIDQLKVLLIDGDGNEILSKFKTSMFQRSLVIGGGHSTSVFYSVIYLCAMISFSLRHNVLCFSFVVVFYSMYNSHVIINGLMKEVVMCEQEVEA